MAINLEKQLWDKRQSAVFCKTTDKFGGLSNMASGFPISLHGVIIRTSEALYQALKFSHRNDIQVAIVREASPINAKKIAKQAESEKQLRPDWQPIRVEVMRYCLRVKLLNNFAKFSEALLETENLQIVEFSDRDNFWGAKASSTNHLDGSNVLGQLLMELRDLVASGSVKAGDPLGKSGIGNLKLYGWDC